MMYVISAILFIGAIAFVGYPFFMHKKEDISQSEANKSAIYSMIEELELDYEMGHISDEEYRELDSKYRAELN